MEEVLELLRERQEAVPVPLDLPDDEQLVEVEEALLMAIPGDLRQYLLLASDAVYGHLEPVTAADPRSHTYLPEVAAQAWSVGVPRYLVPLCETRGDYYCVDPEGDVVFWQEGELSDAVWPSVWHWIRDVWLDA